MKLNSKKNIILCQKALSVEQLKYYAKLCETYSNLAKTREDIPPFGIQTRYSTALSNASQGDLSFLEDEESINFSNEEKKYIRAFAHYSRELDNFRNGMAILNQVLPSPEEQPDLSLLKNFEEHMNHSSKATNNFQKSINNSTRTYIGHDYYKSCKKAIHNIEEIDTSHLPKNIRHISPDTFSVTIYRLQINYISQSHCFKC